jgi:hypothetical protein
MKRIAPVVFRIQRSIQALKKQLNPNPKVKTAYDQKDTTGKENMKQDRERSAKQNNPADLQAVDDYPKRVGGSR